MFQLLSKLTVTSCNFYIVQYVRLAAGRHTQTGDTTDQRRDQRNVTVCPTLIVTKFFINK